MEAMWTPVRLGGEVRTPSGTASWWPQDREVTWPWPPGLWWKCRGTWPRPGALSVVFRGGMHGGDWPWGHGHQREGQQLRSCDSDQVTERRTRTGDMEEDRSPRSRASSKMEGPGQGHGGGQAPWPCGPLVTRPAKALDRGRCGLQGLLQPEVEARAARDTAEGQLVL